MNNLVVADIQVRMDNEGRYCLNDLHKAAGGIGHHQPAKYFANQQARDLVSEIGEFTLFDQYAVTPVVTVTGRNGGTYAVKALVYAYAMWISPAFHLKVIQAYDTLQTQGIAVAEHAAEDLLADPLTYLERVFEQAKKLQAAKQIAEAERDAAVSTIAKVERSIREVARKLPNVNLNQLQARLKELGYLYRGATGTYRVYRQFHHLFNEKFNEFTGWSTISPTEQGVALLVKLYSQSQLPMKTGKTPSKHIRL